MRTESRPNQTLISIVSMAAGLAVTFTASRMGVPVSFLVGLVVGVVTAVSLQRVQLAFFAAGVRKSEGADWMERLPSSLEPLRRPLRAVEEQIIRRAEALEDANARERLRDVTVDALELELHTLDQALGDSRADMAEVLASIDRALASSSPEAMLRRELVELRELVRLTVYAELPSETIALGDLIASVLDAGVPKGRVAVTSTLPSVSAPALVVEALVRSVLGHVLAMSDEVVEVRGILDGAMVALELSIPVGAASSARGDAQTIHFSVARRAAGILGGDLAIRPGRMVLVIPQRYLPGVRAILPYTEWDIPEAM